MKSLKRKTRSDKFPLTLHPSGQYCKKIKGKLYYFGIDKQKALEKYLERSSELHGTMYDEAKAENTEMTLKTLCNIYLNDQHSLVQLSAITGRHHDEQIGSLKLFRDFIGASRKIKNVTTLDLQNYKKMLRKHYSTANRLNMHIGIMKAMFHWARKNDILEQIPNIDAVSREKVNIVPRYVFCPEDIKQLLKMADAKMKAMIWLGLNCGFGCTDCSELEWKNIDFEKGRVFFPRGKTGVFRDLILWPETVAALKRIPRKRKYVFNTSRGNSFVRTINKYDPDGNERYISINTISTLFSRLIRKAGLKVPKGTGFYTLRRTAATMAARSGDPFAVQRLLGHADLKMASRYVQDITKQTDNVIKANRACVLFKA